MIIFYNIKTKEIFGTVSGRVHNEPEKEMIHPSNMDKKDIRMYVIPFKTVYKEKKTAIKKWFIKNKETGEMEERIVGTRIEKVPAGMVPDVKFVDLILAFEAGKKKIYDYHVRLGKDKKVIGFKKK